jgi:hypothetical protein
VTPDHARLRDELGALTARLKEALCCAGLSGWALGDADRLGTLAAELLDRVEGLERRDERTLDRIALAVATPLRIEACPHGLPYHVWSRDPVYPWGHEAVCRPLCDACVMEAVRRALRAEAVPQPSLTPGAVPHENPAPPSP